MSAAQEEMDRRVQEARMRAGEAIVKARMLENRFDFEGREVHPETTPCAWSPGHAPHPVGVVFYGVGKRRLVCRDCWEEVHGHEAIAGS